MDNQPLMQAVEQAQHQHNWGQAIELLHELVGESDSQTNHETAALFNRLGTCYFRTGQMQQAEQAFLRALDSAPDNIDLLNNLAEINLQQQRFDLATDYFNRALRIDPDDVSLLLSFGNCCVQLNRFDTALIAFKRIQRLAPDTTGVPEIISQLEAVQNPSTETRAAEIPPPIFIGGAGRSGTTLVRVILDSHPNITCGPEFKVLPSIAQLAYDFQTGMFPTLQEYMLTRAEIRNAFRELIASLLGNYYRQSGKRRLAEKTPHNVLHFQQLHQLFSQSPLVHVIRDGRDVVCSLLKMNWSNPTTGQPLEYTRNIRKATEYWVSVVKQGRITAQHPSAAERYFELRYEDIVTQPEPTLRQLFEFIGEPWNETVLNFHRQDRNLAGESSAGQVVKPINTQSLGRWKNDLKVKDKRIVKDMAGDLLIELGYAEDKNW